MTKNSKRLQEIKIEFPDFEELGVLGKGSTSIVRLVKEKNTQKLFAVKIISKNDLS